MKKIIYTALTALVLSFATSCESDYRPYEESNDFSDVGYITSLGPDNRWRISGLEVGETISLMDLSQNAVSHEWVIPESGMSLLKAGFSSATTDFSEFILDGTSTDMKTAFALHTKPGDVQVILKNSFSHPVKYEHYVLIDGKATKVAVESKLNKETNLHDIEVPISYKVYDKLSADYIVYKNGDRQNPIFWWRVGDPVDKYTTFDIALTDQITFEVMTSRGDASDEQWVFAGAPTVVGDSKLSTITYTKVGTYKAGNYTMNRTSDSKPMPVGKAVQVIPIEFNVTE